MSLQDFNPNFKSKHVAPHAANEGTADFPYEEIFDRLDGTGGDGESVASAISRQDEANRVEKFCLWIKDVKAKDQRAVKSIGIRFLASMWVINPRLFDNSPGHMVAKSFGVDVAIFSSYAAKFSREFGVRNHFQNHDAKNNPPRFKRDNDGTDTNN